MNFRSASVLMVMCLACSTSVYAQRQRSKEMPIIADPTIDFAKDARTYAKEHTSILMTEMYDWSTSYEDYRVNGAVYTIQSIGYFRQPVLLGGAFDSIGGRPLACVARYDVEADTFSRVGAGMIGGTVNALLYIADTDIYAGGDFTLVDSAVHTTIAHFDGTHWQSLGKGTDSTVLALGSFKGYIYVGGNFRHAGGVEANYIAAWDPIAHEWHPVIDGTVNGVNGGVDAFCASDIGMYVGGGFTAAGTKPAHKIALLQDQVDKWQVLDSGVAGPNSFVSCIIKTQGVDRGFRFGSLYLVCGSFSKSGPLAVGNLGEWVEGSSEWVGDIPSLNGPTYSALDVGMYAFVTGDFSMMDTSIASNIASLIPGPPSYKFSLQPGLDDIGYALAGTWVWMDVPPYGNPLYVGGRFEKAGGNTGANFAIYYGPMGGAVPESPSSAPQVTVFPNPAVAQATIELPDGAEYLYIVDALGRTLRSFTAEQLRESTLYIDTRDFPAGTYHVLCTSATDHFVTSFVVVK